MKAQPPNEKNRSHGRGLVVGAASVPLMLAGIVTDAIATEPCDDFGECKVLIEINSSDGDIGFHWLVDGDDLNSIRVDDPNGKKVYENKAFGPLRDQKLTETFGESAEPLCYVPPEDEQDEDFDEDEVVTLYDFVDRWASGPYSISGGADGGEKLFGETELTYELPAAPDSLDLVGFTIFWDYGTDLGNCTVSPLPEGVSLLLEGEIDAYEVVLEPDVEDGDPTGNLKFTIRVPSDLNMVMVPPGYLASLPDNTPVKIEVGAIGGEDNATFTEADGFCVNDTGEAGCDDYVPPGGDV